MLSQLQLRLSLFPNPRIFQIIRAAVAYTAFHHSFRTHRPIQRNSLSARFQGPPPPVITLWGRLTRSIVYPKYAMLYLRSALG